MATIEEQRDTLIAKIHRMQKRGENVDGQIRALAVLLTGAQNRHLRTMSNKRFGRKKARDLRKAGAGFLAFSK